MRRRVEVADPSVPGRLDGGPGLLVADRLVQVAERGRTEPERPEPMERRIAAVRHYPPAPARPGTLTWR